MKRTSLVPRSFWAVLGLVLGAFALAPASSLAGNAVYTSTDKDAMGCQNGAPDNNINCNIYESKEQVYLSGGPANGSKSLDDGDYFFAILEPGTQQSPIDGEAGNLSSPNDAYAARKFNMTDGVITNLGTHAMGIDKDGRPVIQGMPYDDTTNPGGVYILAVCEWLGDGTANDATNPANCKYDAFKVRESEDPPPGQASDPTVTKDANATFERTFPWSLEKSVACAGGRAYLTYDQLVQKLSGSAKCDYTVAVTKGDGVDSEWKVSGTIKVLNPNEGGSVTLTNVSDDIGDPEATCTVKDDDGDIVPGPDADLVVPPETELEYTYECVYGELGPDPENDTNTAKAEWDTQMVGDDELVGFDGEGTATFAFDGDPDNDNPKLVDDCAAVTDLLDAGPATTLEDPLCESKTFNYSHYFAIPASGCADHSNTATVTPADVGAPDSDSTSVRICGPVGGEGTMGFWQNKNGQALIKGSTPNVGECGLTDYLRAYNPFKDLADGSTCKVVAEYATKIIKAASSSGAAMNAMLKAQMLSTALDVYFPSRGVSGAAVMDISAYSAAFGGATSMTVAGMLTYASTQSNSGGTAWYGQNKQTQGKAKDAFDAINNGVALSI